MLTSKEELALKERALNSMAKSSARMLAAWFETADYSDTVTGVALGRAVYSRACAVSRSAYHTLSTSIS
jgi:hypothetical protein